MSAVRALLKWLKTLWFLLSKRCVTLPPNNVCEPAVFTIIVFEEKCLIESISFLDLPMMPPAHLCRYIIETSRPVHGVLKLTVGSNADEIEGPEQDAAIYLCKITVCVDLECRGLLSIKLNSQHNSSPRPIWRVMLVSVKLALWRRLVATSGAAMRRLRRPAQYPNFDRASLRSTSAVDLAVRIALVVARMSLTNVSPEQAASAAKISSRTLATLPTSARNDALDAIYQALATARQDILAANARDLETAAKASAQGELSPSLVKRLDLSRKGKFDDMLQGIRDVRGLADPVGRVDLRTELDDGLILQRQTCPIGVLLIIFEARPEVIANIASLAIKSANAAILKGGKESTESFKAISTVISKALEATQVPNDSIQLVTTRDAVDPLLELSQYIDLVIPRGSNELVRHCQKHAHMPVLGHADGLCHAYVHSDADLDMAVHVIVDSKTDYPAACNALESLLVHERVLETVLPALAVALQSKGVELRCDPASKTALVKHLSTDQSALLRDAKDADYSTEFLDLTLAIRTISISNSTSSIDAAIDHINTYGSHHTDIILSTSQAAADRFMAGVDSACKFWNASTRFSDGMRFGFGTEVGISTNKVHARGPVGLEGLMIHEYRIAGNGQGAAMYGGGDGKRQYKHRGDFDNKETNKALLETTAWLCDLCKDNIQNASEARVLYLFQFLTLHSIRLSCVEVAHRIQSPLHGEIRPKEHFKRVWWHSVCKHCFIVEVQSFLPLIPDLCKVSPVSDMAKHPRPEDQHQDPEIPKKVKIQAVCEWEASNGRTGYHEDVFRWAGVSHTRGWQLLRNPTSAASDDIPVIESRGRPSKLTPEDVHAVEQAIEEHGWSAKSMSWQAIATDVLHKEVSGRTLQRAMGTMEYYRCIVCKKGWVSKELAKARLEFAQAQLDLRPTSDDWRPVRFSDESSRGYGSAGKSWMIRRPGERICKDCIKIHGELAEGEKKCDHCWAAAGYKFKSKLVIYDAGSPSSKMDSQTYLDSVLKPVVKPWLQQDPRFILEGNRSSAHGLSKNHPVYEWKQQHGLKYYFNCRSSPDLSPIEDCWQPLGLSLTKISPLDDETARSLCLEGWADIPQAFINYNVSTMPTRLKNVLELDGAHA
nr:putative gamma-glutamyl phosphate reductase [Quercus suber]